MDLSGIISALIGVLGVVGGVLLGELVRRRQRAEQFASVVFSRRLEVYEQLLGLLRDGEAIADEVIQNGNLSGEERHALISSVIFPIAAHVDGHMMYIDEYLGAHCTALFMGVEDIADLPEAERKQQIDHHRRSRANTRKMILEDSGVAVINRLFKTINKPTITSPLIERIRELRREQMASSREP
jgi:hypothetical protein